MQKKIIDVSRHQEKIDWSKVKGNVDGVIIRCGFGADISKNDDSQFKSNVEGCIKNGIPFGIYLYSYAKSMEAAISEANHVLRLVGPYKDMIAYPIYYDLEENGTQEGAVERAKAFGDIIEAAGYWCGIYANQSWWKEYLGNKLDRFTKWVARYSSKPPEIGSSYDMWQFTDKGSVPGIKGPVDMSYCYRDFEKIIRK